MNREIKFRGLNKKGDWVYGSYHYVSGDGLMRERTWENPYFNDKKVSFDKHMIFVPTLPDTVGWNYSDTYSAHDVEKESVGEYTGLKDKNGKEIYEGDVLQHPDGNKFEVKFKESYCAFRAVYKDGDCSNLAMQIGEKGSALVVGNTYEQPELLKGDKE